MDSPFYVQSLAVLLQELKTDSKQGLDALGVRKVREEVGENTLRERKKDPLWGVFINQFRDFLVLVLLFTTLISLSLGEYLDALVIFFIVIMNAFLGFIQEYRAERAVEALKTMTAPLCRVVREGVVRVEEARNLVPGDVILFSAGDKVPADARLLEAHSLYADESPLSGESLPVAKSEDFLGKDDTPLGDRRNCVFMGTAITQGRGKAVVVHTGMQTEIGRIAKLMEEKHTFHTPLKARLEEIGRLLVVLCFFLVTLVFVFGVLNGVPVVKMFMTGVSLAVAAIPEGMPAVVTISLSLGVQRMLRKKALIKKLPAIETLGCTSVICSDKTGTLTQNRLSVLQYFYEDGFLPHGEKKVPLYLLEAAMWCNDAVSPRDGNPTETALLQAALDYKLLDEEHSLSLRVAEVPFDSTRKTMSVCMKRLGKYYSYVKGAPDFVLPYCVALHTKEGVKPLTNERRAFLEEALESMTKKGQRVLAVAKKDLKEKSDRVSILERGLTLLGFVGMADPLRPGVSESIKEARRAGITTVMVTGDHKTTALVIARQLGILHSEEELMEGSAWEALSFYEQKKQVHRIRVFARVAPEHKVSIVKALKAQGKVVSMTGDGVNDAPAILASDIGVSMGIAGTDVTKEAAHMVLLDDNYSTIISAVREGRTIYANIRNVIRYLLGCNMGEVLTMLGVVFLRMPLPLLPLQILWMNLITDGLPAIALGFDPAESSIMEEKPRPIQEGVFSKRVTIGIFLAGMMIGASAMGIFVFSLWQGGDLFLARTLAFTTLVVAQLGYVFSCRSKRSGFFSNPYLLAAVFSSLGMHLLILYHPALQGVFRTVPLGFDDWLLVILAVNLSLLLESVLRSLLLRSSRELLIKRT